MTVSSRRGFGAKQRERKPSSVNSKRVTIANQEVIKELTESVKEYTTACEETIKGERAIRHAIKESARYIFDLPDEGNDLLNWDPKKAELMANQFELVGSQHESQAKRVRAQARCLHRMNAAIKAAREEAENVQGEG